MSHHSPPKPFARLPHAPSFPAASPLHPFTAHFPQPDLDRLQRRLDDTQDILTTYENSFAPEEHAMGMRKSWMEAALGHWRAGFDWRKVEREINTYGNWTVSLKARQHEISVHFMGLFSEKEGAVPVVMSHGWPGSIIEFLPLFAHLTNTYTPATLPIHLICPSLPGFGFSGPPPRRDGFNNLDTATLFDELMRGLGFNEYVAQGGDVGSAISRLLGQHFEGCKAVHLNTFHMSPPPNSDPSTLDAFDQSLVERINYFNRWEYAYNHEHATKPATIAMVVSSDPVAMLAWIGEKFLRWSDEDPSLDTILADVTLYWLGGTFPTSLYHYYSSRGPYAAEEAKLGKLMDKPVGYSLFPKDIDPVPLSWAGQEVNLVWKKRHESGGHFSALEKPKELWQDLQDFVQIVWKQ